jgi:signal transduction histidine kinase
VPLAIVPVLADFTSAFLTSGFWSQFLPSLYYSCIVIAGLEFGWKAGLGLALYGGISHALIARFLLTSPFVRLEAQLLAFLVVGFAFLEERRRAWARQKEARKPLELGVRTDLCLDQVSTMLQELVREIGTPFASIEGAAFILDEDSAPQNKREEFVGIIVNECRRVHHILSKLSESAVTVPLECRPTDASAMLGEVVRRAALEHPDPEVSLRIEVAPDLPPLWCDAERIEQAITPFVASAMSALSAGGEILLAADGQNGQARIQLRILGQTIRGGDPAEGRGSYSSTFDEPSGLRVLEARRTMLQHGGTITLDQTGHLRRLLLLTLPLYNNSTA